LGDWEVITASSGSEGVSKALSELPDAIILDVMMLKMDRPTTFEKLRENTATQNIPGIFLTAKAQISEQRTFADLGAKAVIAKPFEPMLLTNQVAEILGWSSNGEWGMGNGEWGMGNCHLSYSAWRLKTVICPLSTDY
jgi:CheY-like chemotaxis protein